MKIQLIARGRMDYGTRRLRAGDMFKVTTQQEANLYCSTNLAYPYIPDVRPLPPSTSPETQDVAVAGADDDIDALRDRYAALSGSRPDGRWGVSRLRSEIASFTREAETYEPDHQDA